MPLLEVLHKYGVIEGMNERGSTTSGPSPFSDGGVLRADLKLNVWSDSGGRPVVDGEVVAGDVVGLVQAIEGVSYGRALEILRERFVVNARRQTSEVVRDGRTRPELDRSLVGELEGLIVDVPFLRCVGITPGVAKAWGVGWCPGGPMAGRIVFPVRRADRTLMGYAGLDIAAEERWRFTGGFDPGTELFGIGRVHGDECVKKAAFTHGFTLADDPLEVVRMAQMMALPVVSPMGGELTRVQIAMLLDPAINPTASLRLAGDKGRRGWMTALNRHHWRRCADRPEGRMR